MTGVRQRIRELATRAIPEGGRLAGEPKLSAFSHGRKAAFPFTLVLEAPYHTRTGRPELLRLEEKGETLLGVELALLGRLEAMPPRA